MVVTEWLAGSHTGIVLMGAYQKSTGYLTLTYLTRATVNAEKNPVAKINLCPGG